MKNVRMSSGFMFWYILTVFFCTLLLIALVVTNAGSVP